MRRILIFAVVLFGLLLMGIVFGQAQEQPPVRLIAQIGEARPRRDRSGRDQATTRHGGDLCLARRGLLPPVAEGLLHGADAADELPELVRLEGGGVVGTRE